MPKLSIIVAVFNAERYLRKCIDSILSQTFKDFELILVNDGSSDESKEICDTYQAVDPRIRVFHKENGGISTALNLGLKASKGEFIGFVDCDDWIEPLMYEKMLDTAIMNKADIVICRCQYVKSDETIVKTIGFNENRLMDGITATKEILRDEIILSYSWDKIYRRELYNDICYPVGRVFEDTPTIYKLIYKSSRVATISYIGYNYFQNPNGICNKKHEDISKNIARELDNAKAFHERYLFSKTDTRLKEIVPLCAFKAYGMVRNFIHMLGHKRISLSAEQEQIVDNMMSAFDYHDLTLFSMWEKMDLFLFRISRSLLKTYINIVPYFHKMKE